ncbi:MAG: hypothetical protein LBU88_04850 [Treponema sp.]|jgi:hypothetical protein|nr:hypothetical protein [Treponema sp.]
MSVSITHYAPSADTKGDMCIVDFFGNKVMIDGGETGVDARLLNTELRKQPPGAAVRLPGIGSRKQPFTFILSHWHADHYGYLEHIRTLGNIQKPNEIIYGVGDIPSHLFYLFCEESSRCIASKSPDCVQSSCRVFASNVCKDVAKDENDLSMVTVVYADGFNFFSFGDASSEAIRTSYDEVFQQINACPNPIIKLPHHGSYNDCNALLDKLEKKDKKYIFVISGLGATDVVGISTGDNTIAKVLAMNAQNIIFWVCKLPISPERCLPLKRDEESKTDAVSETQKRYPLRLSRGKKSEPDTCFNEKTFIPTLQGIYKNRFICTNQVTFEENSEKGIIARYHGDQEVILFHPQSSPENPAAIIDEEGEDMGSKPSSSTNIDEEDYDNEVEM